MPTPLILAGCLIFGVPDGDSAKARCPDKPAMSVRIRRIDADERAHKSLRIAEQPGAAEATDRLRVLCLGQTATLTTYGTDRYRRTLADVSCGGIDAATYMVAIGQAVVYLAPKSSPLWALEQRAREMKIGRWALPGQVRPAAWRQGVRS